MRPLSKTDLVAAIDWVIELPKSVPLLIVSFIAILGSLRFAWVNMPSLEAATINGLGVLEFGVNGCWIEIVFRCVFAFLFLAVIVAWGKVGQRIVIKLLWAMLALVILFPTVLLLWDPQFQLESERLDSSLAYVVEEMDLLHSQQQGDWRVWQNFVTGSPKADTEVPQVVSWSTELLNLSNFQLILAGLLGYSDSFLAFSTRGWVLAALGVMLALLGFYISVPYQQIDNHRQLSFRRGLAFWGGVYFTGLAIIQIPSGIAEYFVDRGDYYGSIGSPQRALDNYENAIEFKPVYAFSSRFLLKRGHLMAQLGIHDNLESCLYKSLAFLMSGDLSQSFYWTEQAERVSPATPSLIYLKSGILNLLAINRFNAEEYSEAQSFWRKSLMLDPLNASAWYGMSLASLQLKKFDDASLQSEQIYNLQQYLGFKPLVVPAQVPLYRSWHLFSINQLAAAHDAYRLSKLPESW